MAARQPDVTVQCVLGKISRDHLQCPIFSDRFTEPKVLDCLHSFCQKCLKKVRQSQRSQDAKLVCPLCRRDTKLKGEVSDLPSDFKLSALVDEVNVYEKLIEGQRSEIKCQACDEENQAVSRCMDCDHFLCKQCQAAHKRLSLMKSHQIYTLAQLQSGEVTYKSKIREYTPKCAKHSDQNLTIYCNTCEKLVCTTCAIVDHERHSRVDLPEAVDKCKRDVARMSVKAEQNKAKLKTNISEVDDNYRKLNAMHADTTKKISSKADKEVARIMEEISRIREEEQKLKEEADTVLKDRAKTLETARATNDSHLTDTEKKLDEVNQFMVQASCYEILDFKPKLLFNLKELTEPEKELDSLSSIMDFEEAEGIGRPLGRLVLDNTQTPSPEATSTGSQRPVRWEQKRQMKTFGLTKKAFGNVDGIAAFSNNDIVALDREHNKVITFFTNDNLQSDVISQELQRPYLNHPSHVSVTRDDKIVVLDDPKVMIFNTDLPPCLNQFLPGNYREMDSTPTCLAVDDEDMIAVGYEEEEEISLHKRDGSLIRRIPAPKIGSKLIIYKQQLVYTCKNKRQLSSVDSWGHRVFSVDIPSHDNKQGKWYANDLCCDKDGNIYVAVHGWPFMLEPGEVQLFTSNGQYIGCVITKCGHPYGISCTPAGELVLASGSCILVYHQV